MSDELDDALEQAMRGAQARIKENAERIATAKECAIRADEAMDAEYTIAYALQGLLEIAIVRADVRSYEPPF